MFVKGEFCIVSEGFQIGKAIFTPEEAAAIIKRTEATGKQRDSSETRIDKYSQAMLDGIFNGLLSNDLIQLTSNDEAINGLHRLKSVVETGIPLTGWAVKNVPWEAFKVADRGYMRTTANDVSCSGGNPRTVPVIRYLNNITTATGAGEYTCNLEIANAFGIRYFNDLNWVLSLESSYKGSEKLSTLLKAEIKAALVLAHSKFPKETEIFTQQYLTGNGLVDFCGPKLMRSHVLLGGQRGLARSKRWETSFKTLKALKLFILDDFTQSDLRLADTESYRINLRKFFM